MCVYERKLWIRPKLVWSKWVENGLHVIRRGDCAAGWDEGGGLYSAYLQSFNESCIEIKLWPWSYRVTIGKMQSDEKTFLGQGHYSVVSRIINRAKKTCYCEKEIQLASLHPCVSFRPFVSWFLFSKERELCLNESEIYSHFPSPYVIPCRGRFYDPNTQQLTIRLDYAPNGTLNDVINEVSLFL